MLSPRFAFAPRPSVEGNAPAKRRLIGLLAASLLTAAAPADASTMTFTDEAAFLSALPGPASTLDFDSLSAGTVIASGRSVGGITFTYDFGGVQMLATDVFDTTSAPNFLGTDDGDLFQDGDDLRLGFARVQAIGVFFITADELFDDDVTLTAAGATASLVAADVQQTLLDGSQVFFLGIVDDTNSFTSAGVGTIGGGFFVYNVDDVITAVSVEPDRDGDGIPDGEDNCPDVPNPDQADRGGVGAGSGPDGVGDACQCGDVNGSGSVTSADAMILFNDARGNPTGALVAPELADVNANGLCTTGDATILFNFLRGVPGANVPDRCFSEGLTCP